MPDPPAKNPFATEWLRLSKNDPAEALDKKRGRLVRKMAELAERTLDQAIQSGDSKDAAVAAQVVGKALELIDATGKGGDEDRIEVSIVAETDEGEPSK